MIAIHFSSNLRHYFPVPKAEIMTAAPQDAKSIDLPEKVVPQVKTISGIAPVFSCQLPPAPSR